jgi:RHS repeat-associated protein
LSIFGIKLDEVIYSGNTTNQGNGSLDSNAVRWPLENHLGSIIAVYDNSGALKSDYDYTAFGAATNAGAEAYPYQFTGRRSIETAKLLDYRTRAYDPDCGRFLQRDSIGVWGDVANFGNGYAYVGNDPVNSLDALGLEGEFDQEFDPTVEFHIDFDPTLRAQDMFNLPRPSLSGIRLADIQYVPTVETVHDPDPERPPPPPPEHPSNTSFGLFTVQLPFGLFLRFGGFLAGVQRGGAFQVVGAEGYVDIGAQW